MYEFEYHRPKKLADAVKLIKAKKEGKLMAGGMTLIPTMKQRLAAPSDVIDLSGLDNSGVKRQQDQGDHQGGHHPCGGRVQFRPEKGGAGAGCTGRHDRRPACAPQGHYRWLGGQCRPGRGLPRSPAGTQCQGGDGHPHHRSRQVLQGPVRNSFADKRDHQAGRVCRFRQRLPIRSSRTRRRAMPWSVSSWLTSARRVSVSG